MEKKKLKKISSIFGVVALCGLSSLFLLNESEDKTLVVGAIDSVVIGGGSGTLNQVSFDYDDLGYTATYLSTDSYYNYTYSKIYDGDNEYYSVTIQFDYRYATFGSLSLTDQPNFYCDYTITCENEINNIVLETSRSYVLMKPGYQDLISAETTLFLYFNVYAKHVTDGVVDYEYQGTKNGNNGVCGYFIYDIPSGISTTTYIDNFSEEISLSVDVVSSYDSYTLGYETGYADGYVAGSSGSYQEAYNNGYYNGAEMGYAEGVASQQQAITDAYNNGRTDGFNEGFNSDSTVTSIFSGILQVGLLPINFFLSIFNFNILGINIASFVSALLTIAITVVVIRIIMGSKNG